MSSVILRVNLLNKYFGKLHALDNFNLSVAKGEVWGVLGPNGSGKTTFLSLILGIKKPTSGNFSWFGEPEGKLMNSHIGSLLEVPYFYPYLSIEKNLQITALVRNANFSDIPSVLEKVNLIDRRKAPCYSLSLGMKQRLALAQTLIGNPEVMILDEPTNGLDPEGIADIRQIIKEQSYAGKTIIVASHNLDEIQKVCSHVVILNKGKEIAHGKVDDLLNIKQVAIVDSPQLEQLNDLLISIPGCRILERNISGFVVTFDLDINVSDFNTKISQSGILLDKFELRRPTLEELFLEIVKRDNA